MPRPQIRSAQEILDQPQRFDFDPKAGFSSDMSYRGTIAAMQGLSATLVQAGIRHSYEELGDGFAEVHAQNSGLTGPGGDLSDNTVIDSWEMPGSEIDFDPYMHPTALAMSKGTLGVIKSELTRFRKYTDTTTAFTFALSSNANALALFNLLAQGTTHYREVRRVLRHRRTVGRNFSQDLPYENEEKIYTTEQLLDECASFATPLPQRFVNKINNIPAKVAQTGYKWGWRKLPSSESTIANNKIEVMTEYVLDMWSTFLYGEVS